MGKTTHTSSAERHRHPLVALALGCLLAWTGGCMRGHAPVASPHPASSHDYAGKLPEGAEPRLYDIHLALDPNAERFTGVVEIAVELLEPDDRVVLHAENINLQRVSVRAGDGRPHEVSYVQNKSTGTLSLSFVPMLPSGMNTLHFEYDAPYGEGLLGIYRTVSDGKAYLFSQFEPIAARRAFPCFDEPRFKAPFQMTLTVPKGTFAASNGMVVAEQIRAPEQTTLVFRPTPPLPTYLVALAVGPFDVIEGELGVSPQRPYALPLRGLASAGKGGKLKYASERTGGLVQALESYVDLPYPFAKLDIVAVPDFAWGAMENAGLITFRDWLLLMDGTTPPYSQRRAFETVMAHELTHQWFGNWVTMAWWDDLWLNEAFASWRGQRTAQHTRPGMQFDLELIEASGNAMREDGLKSVRRVREPCNNKDDIHSAADTITYQKGAGVLAMFEHYIGPERFMEGVRAYLKRFPFASADSGTFLSMVSQVSGEPALAESMQSFLDQPGVPEVSFSWTCDEGQAQLHLTQDRWRPLGTELGDGLWKIPVCFRYGTANGGKQKVCTMLKETSRDLPLRGCPSWFVANADGAGYYRSRVADEEAVARSLVQHRTSALEAMALLDNTVAELQSGAAPSAAVMHRLDGFLSHENPRVVRRVLGMLDGLRRRYVRAKEVTQSQTRMAALLRPQARRLQAEQARLSAQLAHRPAHGSEVAAVNDALGETSLAHKEVERQLALAAADTEVRTTLSHQGILWLDAFEANRDAPDRDAKLRAVQAQSGMDGDKLDLALIVAAETLGAPFIDRLIEVLRHESGGELRKRVVQALGSLSGEENAARVRALVQGDLLHVNELLSVLQPQLEQGPLQAQAWAFVLKNLDALLTKLSEKDRARLITSAGWQCSSEAAKDLQVQFVPHAQKIPGAGRAMLQAQEAMMQCEAEVQTQGDGVRAYFLAPR